MIAYFGWWFFSLRLQKGGAQKRHHATQNTHTHMGPLFLFSFAPLLFTVSFFASSGRGGILFGGIADGLHCSSLLLADVVLSRGSAADYLL